MAEVNNEQTVSSPAMQMIAAEDVNKKTARFASTLCEQDGRTQREHNQSQREQDGRAPRENSQAQREQSGDKHATDKASGDYCYATSTAGFDDPNAVVSECLKVLRRGIYTNIRTNLVNVSSKGDYPDGVKLFLTGIPDHDAEVEENVASYIHFPNPWLIKRNTTRSYYHALLFMLYYLRRRGALLIWNVQNLDDSLASLTNYRYMGSWLTTMLSRADESTFQATASLGQFLNVTLSTAYAHNVYFMRRVLTELFAEVFVDVQPAPQLKSHFSKYDRTRLAEKAFYWMIENALWDQYRKCKQGNHVGGGGSGPLEGRRNDYGRDFAELMTIPAHLPNYRGRPFAADRAGHHADEAERHLSPASIGEAYRTVQQGDKPLTSPRGQREADLLRDSNYAGAAPRGDEPPEKDDQLRSPGQRRCTPPAADQQLLGASPATDLPQLLPSTNDDDGAMPNSDPAINEECVAK